MYSYTYIVYPASFQPYIIVQGGKQMSSHRQSYLPALLALAVSAFAIGTTEFISVGLLPLISQDLHIPVTTAGLTVSMYALGVTFGALGFNVSHIRHVAENAAALGNVDFYRRKYTRSERFLNRRLTGGTGHFGFFPRHFHVNRGNDRRQYRTGA